jgi:hypothetical protein
LSRHSIVKTTPEQTPNLINYSRPLLAAVLVTGAICQIVAPATAAAVPSIKNQATATYEDPQYPANPKDPNDPKRIYTSSNLIEIGIQEVAGIGVKHQGLTDDNGKAVTPQAGDTVYCRFDVTNIGNDATKFFIPNKATIFGAGTVLKVQYFEPTTKTWQDVPATNGVTSGSFAPQASLQVRVVVKVNPGAIGKITVSLGKTNGTSPNLQNAERVIAKQDPEDVYTVDNADGTNGEIDGSPVNGVREAMDTQDMTITGVGLLNGPKDQPEASGLAIGSTTPDNNLDFTNKSTPVKPGLLAGERFDPDPVGFYNTVENIAQTSIDLKVIPTIKADELLPDGTKITLKDPAKLADAGVNFTVTSGKLVPNDANKPVLVLLQVPSNSNVDYITIIDLPAGTPAIVGYPVKLTAFVDLNNDNLPNPNELQNQTIDRLYSGFIDLFKESRILDPDKKPLNEFSKDNKATKSGQYIEYRIKFTNVSIAAIEGSGSKPLSAKNFTITEDGTVLPNNWATLTANDPGSVNASLGLVTVSPPGNKPDVTKYVNTISVLAPGNTGTFGFIRKVK